MKNKFALIFLFLFTHNFFSQSTYFVKFKEYVSNDESEVILTEHIRNKFQQLNLSNEATPIVANSFLKKYGKLNSKLNNLYEISVYDDVRVSDIIDELSNNVNIEYVQKALNYKIDLIPSDSLFSEQWALQNINAPEAWELIPNESQEIILAVIDTGIDYEHPDLKNNIYKNIGEIGTDNNGNDKSTNGIDDDENGFVDDFQGWDFVNKLDIYPAEIEYDFTDWDNIPMDEHGHGTNITGIIGAEHNSFGIAGVSPNVKILNLRTFDKNGNGEEDDAASAIIYAVKMGAKIINMSWGDIQYSQVLKDVIEYAYENGVILIASSGNSSSNLPHYPSSFSQVISVGAIQENNVLSSFSNYGSTMDLVAPGSQIITTGVDNTYKKISGTSASAPFVSSAASIVASIKNFNNEEIKQLLKSTARDLGESGWDENYGAGSLDLFKALKLLIPSNIKFNFPTQDFATNGNNLLINVTCVSPYFKNYELFYGVGFNPEQWQKLEIGNEEYQIVNEDIYSLDLSSFVDTSYTLRLIMNRIDNTTLEERVNILIDRSAPEVLSFNLFPAMMNDIETVQAAIVTDDPTTAKLFYRITNSNEEFKFISLDGFSNDVQFTSKIHFGFLPIDEILTGINHEFYFEVTNQAGLTTIQKEESNYFHLNNIIDVDGKSSITKEHSLPGGRIFNDIVTIENIDNNFVFLNETESSSDLSIYKYELSGLKKEISLNNRIPVSVGDFNNDGKTDILSLFVKNGFIETQKELGSLEFSNVLSDSSGEFWPALAEDIDDDSRVEIIAFSSDTTVTIWEVQNNFTLIEEVTLNNFVDINNSIPRSIFRNNFALINNFDSDSNKELVIVDDYGRLLFYQINGTGNYENDFIIEPFFLVEANSEIAQGDFNGDGIQDIAILMKFEENIFATPLIYTAVISIRDDQTVDFLFQNMFISTESNYVSSFQKQYHSNRFNDFNNDGQDELIIFTFPNSYIIENNGTNSKLIDFKTNVNSQSIFIGDLDQNGIDEFAIPNNNRLNFYEFDSNNLLHAPIITDYYSIDTNKIFIEWSKDNLPTYIFRGTSSNQQELYDSSLTNNYADEFVEANRNYFYSIANFDPIENKLISLKSKIVNVYSHAPTIIREVKVNNNKNIELFFSERIENNRTGLQNFIFDEQSIPSSVRLSSQNSLLVTSEDELDLGDHTISLKNIRDFYNSPIEDTTIIFETISKIIDHELIVSNFKIIDNHNLIVRFNMSLDTISSLNITNYTFTPNNKIEVLEFNNSENEIHIQTKNPFGSIGREYVLNIEDVYSSLENGYIKISENSGSQIILTDKADNLDDLYVYPNPIKVSENPSLTFANLTSNVDIYIFTLSGLFVKKITEDDGNGGVDWDLLDIKGKVVSSGVYLYKAISLDNNGNSSEEKIGKFAVIK